MSRREFLLSICGAYEIPFEATIEFEPAHEAIGGEGFDIQVICSSPT